MPLDMDPEIRARWCAALRSGEYKQAGQALRITDEDGVAIVGHCCLGVLTDLYLKNGQPEEFTEDSGWRVDVWDADGVLAPPVREWASVDANPNLTAAHTASELNDGGASFAEIADLIDGGV